MSAFYEMESALIRRRVIAGLEAAKQNGTPLGRPELIKKKQLAIQLYQTQLFTVKEISVKSGLACSTIYKVICEIDKTKEEQNKCI